MRPKKREKAGRPDVPPVFTPTRDDTPPPDPNAVIDKLLKLLTRRR